MSKASRTLPGLSAKLDRVVYFYDKERLPEGSAHVFIYFITIANLSNFTVTLNGRRWVLLETSGHRQVIEGDGIVGKEPCLRPGERFSYNSYHITHCECQATGSFHGFDADGAPVHLTIPPFVMKIPSAPEAGSSPAL